MVVFWLRLTTFVTEALVGRFKSRRFDDVCNVCRPPVARLGPAGEVARWFETGVAFARAGRASDETAIAFAGEKWAFLVQFSGAVVMVVSQLPHGCVLARKSSPCARKMAQNQRFVACRANFFAEQPRNGVCRPRSVAPPVRHAHCRATVISGRTGNRLAGITTSGWA